ncbi:MAG: HEPN domain-containing protein [Bacteroidetes bacterium]|nr:HEPN domain-containing protein [Bacteroidota bacterium]
MNKEEHIQYWLRTSAKDLQRANRCFEDADYVFCLFCLHLSLEKIIKALWVKNNAEDTPPKIHNLVKLVKGSDVELPEDDLIFLNDMNKFQLEGRYPDYLGMINKECTKEFTNTMLEKAEKIKTCLLKKLQ